MRALFSETVIRQLEKEIGCKIKMDEKFIFVSGKDRLILAKGVDAVHKLIQGQGEDKDGRSKSPSNRSQKSKSRSPERREIQTSYPNAHQRKGFSQERINENRPHDGSHKLSRDSPKGRGLDSLCLLLKQNPTHIAFPEFCPCYGLRVHLGWFDEMYFVT